jgi:predicted Zn-ribbon and HTH transcriptional regulator
MICPECRSDQVNTRLVVENFPYELKSIPRRAGTVRVVIPVRQCLTCSFEWLDGEADAVRARALAKALRT